MLPPAKYSQPETVDQVLVYSFVAHWVWSENGWLVQLGAHDFAGSELCKNDFVVEVVCTTESISHRLIPVQASLRRLLGYASTGVWERDVVFAGCIIASFVASVPVAQEF